MTMLVLIIFFTSCIIVLKKKYPYSILIKTYNLVKQKYGNDKKSIFI